jgi:hypothetical protein
MSAKSIPLFVGAIEESGIVHPGDGGQTSLVTQ